jgi:type II secretory pathway pseudopilin PulG
MVVVPAHARCRRPVAGFTVFELIVLLGVLGILVALAAPQLDDLTARGRMEKMNAMQRTLDQSVQRAHVYWRSNGRPATIRVAASGVEIPMPHGWPDPVGALRLLGAAHPPVFVSRVHENELIIIESDATPQRARCRFTYIAPPGPGGSPRFASDVTTGNCRHG